MDDEHEPEPESEALNEKIDRDNVSMTEELCLTEETPKDRPKHHFPGVDTINESLRRSGGLFKSKITDLSRSLKHSHC